MSSSRQVIVSRNYQATPDYCVQALELLLKKSVSKAVRPAPEPDGCDGTKSKEDSANAILPH